MDDALKLQSFFQAIGEANRLRMIRFIGRGSRAVSEIVAETKLSQPLVSHHLRTLKNNGVLETRREGPFVYYALKDTRLLDILGLLLEVAPNSAGRKRNNSMFQCPSFFIKLQKS